MIEGELVWTAPPRLQVNVHAPSVDVEGCVIMQTTS
eukprot:CAMPEP_0113266480 /NCGR_PEP_ID=MMETSP0008_2-20120614/20084_1 /TAXON_ID=97485 /ORGANISM="Prymnesium parvum" /LENGTH=35 /DNA_ID=CAMNT_0000115421 /DNA_START=75 /DNA_END=179 /DNA_ORIENTATION=+ /assembly_acc=CAM_ASM_000153